MIDFLRRYVDLHEALVDQVEGAPESPAAPVRRRSAEAAG